MIIKKKFKQIETTEGKERISNRSKIIKEFKPIKHHVKGKIVYGNNALTFQ